MESEGLKTTAWKVNDDIRIYELFLQVEGIKAKS